MNLTQIVARIKNVDNLLQEKLPQAVEFFENLNWNINALRVSGILNALFLDEKVYFDAEEYRKNYIREYFIEGNFYQSNNIVIKYSDKLISELATSKTFSTSAEYELKRVLIHEFTHREQFNKIPKSMIFKDFVDFKEYLSDNSEMNAIAQDVIIDYLHQQEESYNLDMYVDNFACSDKTFKKFHKKLYKMWTTND